MDAHIIRFNQLLQEIEHNKPTIIPSLQPESVNLQFMLSIGGEWETFSLAKDEWIRQVSTAELHSEIRAMDARKTKPTITQPPSLSTSDIAKALALYYDNRFNEQGGHRRRNDNWNDALWTCLNDRQRVQTCLQDPSIQVIGSEDPITCPRLGMESQLSLNAIEESLP